MLRRRRRPALGVDLGVAFLKIVELEPRAGRPALRQARSAPTPAGAVEGGSISAPAPLAAALGELVQAGGWAGRRAVTAIGGRQVLTRQLRLPPMPPAELAQAVQWEAQKYLPVAERDLILDFLPLDSPPGGQQAVLLAAAPRPVVLAYHAVFEEAGLKLAAVDIVPAALARWLTWRGKRDTGPLAVLDVGERESVLVVVEGGKPAFNRGIALGEASLREAAEGSGFFPAEAALTAENTPAGAPAEDFLAREVRAAVVGELAQEVRRSLDFYRGQARGGMPGRLILAGGAARLPWLGEALGQELEMAVEVETGEGEADPGLAVAIGLALREVVA